jgi:Na+/proline symporter
MRMTSVLETAIFAYTIYGVSITPALIAALVWKRTTKAGGLASILSGAVVALFLRVMVDVLPPDKVIEGDPWGIPIIFPALFVSLLSLFGVSFLTKKPKPEELTKFFPEKKKEYQKIG